MIQDPYALPGLGKTQRKQRQWLAALFVGGGVVVAIQAIAFFALIGKADSTKDNSKSSGLQASEVGADPQGTLAAGGAVSEPVEMAEPAPVEDELPPRVDEPAVEEPLAAAVAQKTKAKRRGKASKRPRQRGARPQRSAKRAAVAQTKPKRDDDIYKLLSQF